MGLTRKGEVIINPIIKTQNLLTMAENSRGQSRNGQRNRNDSPSRSTEITRSNSKRNSSGLRDTNLDRVRNDNRSPKSSGISQKRFITGSDYDGQLSDE
jgi:hypothetical protein